MAISKQTSNKMDDRFYVAILLAHRLYELRRGTVVAPQEAKDGELILVKTPNIRKVR